MQSLYKTPSGLIKINDHVLYNPEKVLGKGSNGVVYKGFHEEENCEIAVKFIPQNKLRKNEA